MRARILEPSSGRLNSSPFLPLLHGAPMNCCEAEWGGWQTHHRASSVHVTQPLEHDTRKQIPQTNPLRITHPGWMQPHCWRRMGPCMTRKPSISKPWGTSRKRTMVASGMTSPFHSQQRLVVQKPQMRW